MPHWSVEQPLQEIVLQMPQAKIKEVKMVKTV
jgi:hypothetical protein